MEEEVKVTVELFEEEKYEKNLKENVFNNKDNEGIGD